MDVHKASTTLAILPDGSDDPEVLQTVSTVPAIRKIFRRLSQRGTPRSCYEASGAGYVLQRGLDRSGFHCEVIASGLIPRRPGDRRKNDRLDAINLARHYRAGNLVPIEVPDVDREAARQLVRSRFAVQRHLTRLKHRIVRVMATHGYSFSGTKSNWTLKHRAWLRRLQQDIPGVLVEAAWHQRHGGGASQKLKYRRQGRDPLVLAIAQKAQNRLHRRFLRLIDRKGTYKAVTAVARELTGFVWAAMMVAAEEV